MEKIHQKKNPLSGFRVFTASIKKKYFSMILKKGNIWLPKPPKMDSDICNGKQMIDNKNIDNKSIENKESIDNNIIDNKIKSIDYNLVSTTKVSTTKVSTTKNAQHKY